MPPFLSPKWKAPHDMQWETWSETPWVHFFHTGKWCILLQTVCLSGAEVPKKFWEQQNRMLSRIQEEVAAKPGEGEETRAMKTVLRQLRPMLEAMTRNGAATQPCRAIATELGRLIKEMGLIGIPRDGD
jgi:hypothetical protein